MPSVDYTMDLAILKHGIVERNKENKEFGEKILTKATGDRLGEYILRDAITNWPKMSDQFDVYLEIDRLSISSKFKP